MLSVFMLCSVGACRDRRQDDRVRPAPEHAVVSSAPAPRTTDVLVEVTVVQWLAVGWAQVINVKLGGDLQGIGSLWVPFRDPAERRCVSAASRPGQRDGAGGEERGDSVRFELRGCYFLSTRAVESAGHVWTPYTPTGTCESFAMPALRSRPRQRRGDVAGGPRASVSRGERKRISLVVATP